MCLEKKISQYHQILCPVKILVKLKKTINAIFPFKIDKYYSTFKPFNPFKQLISNNLFINKTAK